MPEVFEGDVEAAAAAAELSKLLVPKLSIW